MTAILCLKNPNESWDLVQYIVYLSCCFLGGFKVGVFPGVFLLSRWRLSGLPVDSAILFGPGLSAIIINVFIVNYVKFINDNL